MQALPASCVRGIGCRQHCGRAYYTFHRPGHEVPTRRRVSLRIAAQKQGNDSTSKQSIPPLHRYFAVLTLTKTEIRLCCSFAGCQCALTGHASGTIKTKTLCRPQTFTSEPEGIFKDLEKTALNPFLESKTSTSATASQGRRDEAKRQESWQQMMGERWARAIYSYYNWRTVGLSPAPSAHSGIPVHCLLSGLDWPWLAAGSPEQSIILSSSALSSQLCTGGFRVRVAP